MVIDLEMDDVARRARGYAVIVLLPLVTASCAQGNRAVVSLVADSIARDCRTIHRSSPGPGEHRPPGRRSSTPYSGTLSILHRVSRTATATATTICWVWSSKR